MIYKLIISHLDFPEPLVEITSGRVSRVPDPFLISAVLQRIGEEKMRYVALEGLKLSIFHENRYFALLVHDEENEDVEDIGKALEEYFKSLSDRMPEEKEVKDVFMYALLPKPSLFRPYLEPKSFEIKPRYALENRPKLSEEEAIEAFLAGRLEEVVARSPLENDKLRAMFVFSADVLYSSSPKVLAIDPRYVYRVISKIEDPLLREFLYLYTEFSLGKVPYTKIALFSRTRAKEILRYLDDPVYASIFSLVTAVPEIFERAYESVRGKSEYFASYLASLVSLRTAVKLSKAKDVSGLRDLYISTRMFLIEAIKKQDYTLAALRLYGHFLASYIYLNMLDDVEESKRILLEISSRLPLVILPELETRLIALSTVVFYPMRYSIYSIYLLAKYNEYFEGLEDPGIIEIRMQEAMEAIRYFLKRVKAGRVLREPALQIASSLLLVSELAYLDLGIKNPYSEELRELVEHLGSTHPIEELHRDARYNLISRYAYVVIASALSIHTHIRKENEKAISLLERILLYYSLDEEDPSKLDLLAPIYYLLELYEREGAKAEKLISIKRLIERAKLNVLGKAILLKKLYDVSKRLGMPSDFLLEVYEKIESLRVFS